MPLYKQIIDLDTEAALALSDYFEMQKPDGAKTKKALLSTLSGLINNAIEGAIIEKAAPVGSVKMFAGSVAPSGWLFCDNSSLLRAGTYAALFAVIGTVYGTVDGTHFNVPDFRGIFPRGAGTSAKLTNANAVAFAGVLGTYQNDKLQGHHHIVDRSDVPGVDAGALTSVTTGAKNRANIDASNAPTDSVLRAGDPQSDGTNGPTRTGTETNPANLGINFIIKY